MRLDEGATPTNKHAVYQWTISPGASAGPALAHVVKRRALRESARWWRDEDGRRVREETTGWEEEGKGGGRLACARHACASFSLPGMSFVIHSKLLFTKTKKNQETIGDPLNSTTTRIQNFRNQSKLSYNVKAADSWVALLQKLLVPPLSPPQAPFCCVACQLGAVPVAFATTRDACLFALPNEMTKQQICICRNRCCNRFDSTWPKLCWREKMQREKGNMQGKKKKKKSLWATSAWRYLGSDGHSGLHHLPCCLPEVTI